MSILPLKWDSSFLKLNVDKLVEPTRLISLAPEAIAKYDVIYIENNHSKKLPKAIKSLFHIEYTDHKIIYSKKVVAQNMLNTNVQPYSSSFASKKMIELAIQSGAYSRFKLDSKFDSNVYKKLYTKWIRNSVALKTANIVLVYGNVKNPLGFITIVGQEKKARIGLIAVDETKQNAGIGRALIIAAENFALHNNFTTLQVITQSKNKIACTFYEKCGFKKESEIITYHHWKQ